MLKKRFRQNQGRVVVLAGLLVLMAMCFFSVGAARFLSAWAGAVSATDVSPTDVSPTDWLPGVSYSDMRIVPRTQISVPLRSPNSPALRGNVGTGLTHTTAKDATILLSALLTELNLEGEAKDYTVTPKTQDYFDVTKQGDDDQLIKTKRSFDTLEEITLTKAGSDPVTVIFKDSRYTTNLNDLCTDVKLLINGQTYTADNVFGEDTVVSVSGKKLYELEVTFTERSDKQFSDYERLVYTLPSGFTLPSDFNDMGYTLSINMDIGGILKDNQVTCSSDGTILYVDWNRKEVEKFNRLRDASGTRFTLVLSGNLDPNGGEFIFAADKILKFDKEDLHNAIVHKSVKYVPYEMSYTIVVISDGTTENLTLTDVMGIALGEAENVEWQYGYQKHPTTDTDYSQYVPTYTNEIGKLVFNIPKMDDEDELYITYNSKVDVEKIERSGHATMEETGNTATLTGDSDPSDNEEIAYVPGVKFGDISKEGTGAGNVLDGSVRYGLVNWKIDMNRNVSANSSFKLAGTALSDYIGEAYRNDTVYYGEGIQVVCRDEQGVVQATRDIPWEDLGVDPMTDKSWTYPIPEGDPKYHYQVTYQTGVSLTGKTKDFLVDNTAIGKCGEAQAEVVIHPRGPGNVAVHKSATDIQTNQVTWRYDLTVKNDALNSPLILQDYQFEGNDSHIEYGRLPRKWLGEHTNAKTGETVLARTYQEHVKEIEVSGLLPGEVVKVVHWYNNLNTGSKEEEVRMAIADGSGVVKFTDLSLSKEDVQYPENRVFMYFYKDEIMNPGLQEPADGSRIRKPVVKMTNTFKDDWVNAVEEYRQSTASYSPYMYDHINYVEFTAGGDATTERASFSVQPVNLYKQVMTDGTAPTNSGGSNPIDSEGNVYPVYRFRVAVNGVTTDDPLVIEDAYDTSLFKLLDYREFGNGKGQSLMEQVLEDGTHKEGWLTWLNPVFAGQSYLAWESAADVTNGGDRGPVYKTYDNKTIHDVVFVDSSGERHRAIWNDVVKVEESSAGARFTFLDMSKFKKANGEHSNYYVVEYALVPKDLQALARLETIIDETSPVSADDEHAPEKRMTTFTNTATCRKQEATVIATYRTKNDLLPVTKKYMLNGDSEGTNHPRLKFDIKINPGRMRLNEGQSLFAIDEYSSSLSIDFTTLKIETQPAGAPVSYDFSQNVGTYFIPDETYVHITYTASIVGLPEGGGNTGPVSFANKVTVGAYSASVANAVDVSYKTEGYSVVPEINIFKYCSNHMEKGLEGVTFGLYRKVFDTDNPGGNPDTNDPGGNPDTNDPGGNPDTNDPGGNPDTNDPGGNSDNNDPGENSDTNNPGGNSDTNNPGGNSNKYHFEPIEDEHEHQPITVTTVADGKAKLYVTDTQHGMTLDLDADYYLREISVPPGYEGSTVYYKFHIQKDGKVDYGQYHYLNGDTLTVRNTPISIGFQIHKVIETNIKLTEEEKNALTYTLQTKDEDGKWVDYTNDLYSKGENGENNGYYKNIPFSSFEKDPLNPNLPEVEEGKDQPTVTGHYALLGLVPGEYRLVENGNGTILQHHNNLTPHFSVKAEWDDRDTNCTTDENYNVYTTFSVTNDHLWQANDREVTLTNKYTTETVKRVVQKRWSEPDGTLINWPQGLKVQLQVFSRHTVEGVTEETLFKTIELDGVADKNGESPAGTATFSGLPKYDSVTKDVADYYVREITVIDGNRVFHGYVPSDGETEHRLPDQNTVTITNKKTATKSLRFTKEWVESLPTTDPNAEFGLYAYEEGANPSTAKLIQIFTLQKKTGEEGVTVQKNGSEATTEGVTVSEDGLAWSYTFTGLNDVSDRDVPLVYFVRERSCSFPYEPIYPEGQTYASTGDIIRNRIASINFTVTKQWKDTLTGGWPANMTISLHLRRYKTVENEVMIDGKFKMDFNNLSQDSKALEKTAENRYLLTVPDLPKYDVDGALWVYYVTEDAIEHYLTQYTDKNRTVRPDDATNGGYIINQMEHNSLTLRKTVAGSHASKLREFAFTVTVHLPDGTPLTGNMKLSVKQITGDSKSLTVTFDENGQTTVYLRHGDSATLQKLPSGSTFTVEEADPGTGYTVQVNGKDGRNASGALDTDMSYTFVNTREGIVRTGVRTGIVISAELLALACAAMALTVVLRRQREH